MIGTSNMAVSVLPSGPNRSGPLPPWSDGRRRNAPPPPPLSLGRLRIPPVPPGLRNNEMVIIDEPRMGVGGVITETVTSRFSDVWGVPLPEPGYSIPGEYLGIPDIPLNMLDSDLPLI